MKTTGNCWYPTKEQKYWPEDAQIVQSEQQRLSQQVSDTYDALFSSGSAPDAIEVKESVTVAGMVFTPAEIKTLLHFAKLKEGTSK